jgi:hypothetical protein
VAPLAVTPDRLGAWVIKCHPGKTALAPMRQTGRAAPQWCVADNYRTRLMRRGQPVLFWVVAHPQRGIWGAGHLTGAAVLADGRWHVPTDITLFDDPLTAATLRAVPGLAAMEVFRSPQQANPSWVNTAELTALRPLLPDDRFVSRHL